MLKTFIKEIIKITMVAFAVTLVIRFIQSRPINIISVFYESIIYSITFTLVFNFLRENNTSKR
ncbi:hypothetical protein SAMN02745249_01959 [Atopostipes suicloacalis DSM 15692]|uniref:Uncharacterized protein n=1 Tax=Atopostipes suicloacalis DSM 15692 TaxID=1121025 RepID=A0A1M4ZGR2_9LACT|nr:hypothetical protein SAMN02745249_01959 [Atopostipes suicloacalis DSM 15692]